MEELKRFQSSTFDTVSRRKLVEDQDTIHEFTARIQGLQNEDYCMNDSRDFKDAESVRSGLYHVTSQPAFLPPFRDPGGMLSRSVVIRLVYLEKFLHIQQRLLQHLIRKSSIHGVLIYIRTHITTCDE